MLTIQERRQAPEALVQHAKQQIQEIISDVCSWHILCNGLLNRWV